MAALYIMIPTALLLVGGAIYIFFWAVDSGQYDDMEGPAHSVMFEDADPRHQAALDEVAHREASIKEDRTLPRKPDAHD